MHVTGRLSAPGSAGLGHGRIRTVNRVGFTFSRALFGKKYGGPSSRKKLATFPLLITLVVHSGVAYYFGISGMQKIRRSFCGAPTKRGPHKKAANFLWGPLFGRTC